MAVTTRNVFKNQVRKHIVEILSTNETEVLKDQLQNVVNAFYNWYSGYEQKRNPNWGAAFIDWNQGLPSEINMEFRQYKITEILKEWVENTGEVFKERSGELEEYTYRSLVTREFTAMCKLNNVEVFK